MDISQQILSDIVVFNKYAKYIPSLRRRETWQEICDRNLDMHIKKFPMLETEARQIYKDFVYTRKVLPSMRSMQFGGRPIELANNRIFNCAYLAVNSIEAFSETLFLLMGGSGVGYSVQEHHVAQLPVVVGAKKQQRRFLVGDSIEGWADAVKVLVKAHFLGKAEPAFDFRDIRHKGAMLITSGGKAPGPDPLRICIEYLRAILNGAQGRKLTSLEAHDMMCHIADAVLSGGIRRAALIALFSPTDMDMMTCKAGAWYELNPQRGRANNSVALLRDATSEDDFKAIWTRIKESNAGEPGVFWTNDLEMGTNPCVSGDTLVTVVDHGATSNGESISSGVVYEIPMKMLVEQFESSDLPPNIVAYNPSTGKVEIDTMTAAALTRRNADLIKLTMGDGSFVKVTPDHKIFTKNHGWIEAKDLELSDELVSIIQADQSIENTNLVSCEIIESEDVYDITVKNNHNFFANGVLVHNCAEISLNNMQFCNLTEMNVSDVETQEELNAMARAAAFIGTLQAGYTDFHYLRPQWEENTKREALIGVGQTGIGSGKVLKLNLVEAAKEVLSENERVAKIIGINCAARTTTVKPSGTTSTVVGSASGIHAWHNDFYQRRVRIGKNEAMYSYMVEQFPTLIEDCHFKPHLDAVMSFPQKAPEGSILRNESVHDILERVKKFNVEWVQTGHRSGANFHNVSSTISLKSKDWDPTQKWMWKNRADYTGISVLPYDGGSYVQAPFQDCSEDMYNDMMGKLHNIDMSKIIEADDNTALNDQAACGGNGCAV